ncbi:MAG TPA: hypothetical protein GXX40_04105 [Firmicutes bacterium]|nr:hypothetical protein [Bacillota bacterium]
MDIKKCESLLKRIKGVIAAKVAINEQDHTCEAYILAGPARSTNQIEKDARTVIEGAFETHVPAKIVVCQIHQALESVVLKERIRLCEVTTKLVEDAAEVAVKLALEDRHTCASCRGTGGQTSIARLACAATLAGIEKLVPGTRLSIAEVKFIQFSNYSIVTALVQAEISGAECKTFLGSCLVDSGTYAGIAVGGARSVLNALNRVIEKAIR